jgi:hypothetical protein
VPNMVAVQPPGRASGLLLCQKAGVRPCPTLAPCSLALSFSSNRQTRRSGTTALPLDEPPGQMPASAMDGPGGEDGDED